MSGSLFKRIPYRSAKWVIVLSSLVTVFIWHGFAILKDSRIEKVASELASAKEFFKEPGPNHSGTKLFYAQTSENGVTAYLVDTATGEKKFLYEHEQSHLDGVGLLGWSPDDKLFAYAVRAPEGKIIICDGDSGDPVGSVSESKILQQGVWLSAEAFVYVNTDQGMGAVRKSGNEWKKGRLFTRKAGDVQKSSATLTTAGQTSGKTAGTRRARSAHNPIPIEDQIEHLTAISDTAVAWQQGGGIWNCEIGADTPSKIWDSTTNTLLDFYFSRQREIFLLHCKDDDSEFVASFYPASIWHNERLTNFDRLSQSRASTLTNFAFVNDGKGYVFLVRSPASDLISIRPDGSSEPLSLSWDSVDYLVANEGHLFVLGSSTNGPSGIWDYDIKLRSLNSIVSGLDRPFQYARITSPTDNIATNFSGGKVSFRLWPAANFVPGRKYPLVISVSGRKWRAQEASIPNAGSFLASVETDWSKDFQGDIAAVVRASAQNPNIDPNHLYIVGVSAGAAAAAYVVMGQPKLWRGAILLSPVYFPPPSRIKGVEFLLDSGDNDAYLKEKGGVKKLMDFQEAAARFGVPVSLSIHSHASHVYRSGVAEKERIRQMMEFLERS